MIRTPDQRLRVFISSTLGELAAERHAVADAIIQLRLTPVLFELGARPYPPRELYRAYLEQSDIFIGIYAQSYGWIAPDMDVSGLEDEYRLSGDKPRLIYVKRAEQREPRLAELLDSIRAEGRVSYRASRTPTSCGDWSRMIWRSCSRTASPDRPNRRLSHQHRLPHCRYLAGRWSTATTSCRQSLHCSFDRMSVL